MTERRHPYGFSSAEYRRAERSEWPGVGPAAAGWQQGATAPGLPLTEAEKVEAGKAFPSPAAGPSSWVNEVQGVGESTWTRNACRYATEAEANEAGIELLGRWFGAQATRAAPTNDPVNYRFDFDAYKSVPLHGPGSKD